MSTERSTPSVPLSELFISDVEMLRELVGREGNESYDAPLRRVLTRLTRCERALLEIDAIWSLSYENAVRQALRRWVEDDGPYLSASRAREFS